MPYRKNIVLLFLIVWSAETFAKESKSVLALYEDTLVVLQKNIFKTKSEKNAKMSNVLFLDMLKRTLAIEGSFDYPFDSLTGISRLMSQDKKVKILNWNLAKEDGTYEYYGFIQTINRKTGNPEVFELIDKSDEIRNIEQATFDYKKWFGMLYYKIIHQKINKKDYYVLLAWDGNDKISSKKIIDVLFFNEKGTPQFGESLFKIDKKIQKRVVFEHSAEVVMSLKYEEKNNRIVFNHLSPPNESLKGYYQYYGPDFSFDAFEFKKDKWIFVEDIDARNKKNTQDHLYRNPKENQATPK